MGDLDQFSGGGQFLSKGDVTGPIVTEISGTSAHTFPGDNRAKLVLHFQTPGLKPMACNPTNVDVLKRTFGVTKQSQLIGRAVEIFTDPTVRSPSGQVVGGLRLRAPSQAPPQQQTSPQPAVNAAYQPQQSISGQQTTVSAPQQQGWN